MKNQQLQIFIIGGGVSGLIAALELERLGYEPTILEASNHLGGRVKTDIEHGYPLDHGFQVLLTEYPAAKRYLNFDQLELQYFLPGAVIFDHQHRYTIGDPTRNLTFLVPTLLASIGSIKDKLKILNLSNKLKRQSIQSIFNEPEMTTLEYLQGFGFSKNIIQYFFRPFFSGIFLEPDLKTSSRMFCFVYKMFAQGNAVIPKYGIKMIPLQLKEKLKRSKILLNSSVERIDGNSIKLQDQRILKADRIIVANAKISGLQGLDRQTQRWNSCTNVYFRTNKSFLKKPIIGLIGDSNSLVNNFHYVTDVHDYNSNEAILSTTILAMLEPMTNSYIDKIKDDLNKHVGIDQLEYLKSYSITKALPVLDQLKYIPADSAIRLNETTFLAGDHLGNPSLNAAMESGRIAAAAVIKSLES